MNNIFMTLETQQASGSSGMWTMVIYVVVIIAVFYFFMIRPQKKQEKETAAMRNNLAVGDEITTIGGIIGRVTHVKDDVVTIESGADRNKIRIKKSAVASIDKKYGEPNVPKGGYKVKSVKKGEKTETPIEAPALKEDNKEENKEEK